MDSSDILYFDYKSGDNITLNLNFPGHFLWYTNVRGPVTFKFARGHLDVTYDNFFLKFTPNNVTIFSDYITPPDEAPESLTSLDISEEQAVAIWQGIKRLLKSNPKKSLGNKTFLFDPFVLRSERSDACGSQEPDVAKHTYIKCRRFSSADKKDPGMKTGEELPDFLS